MMILQINNNETGRMQGDVYLNGDGWTITLHANMGTGGLWSIVDGQHGQHVILCASEVHFEGRQL